MKTAKQLEGAEKFGIVVQIDPNIDSDRIYFPKKLEEAKKAGPFVLRDEKSKLNSDNANIQG